MITVHNIQLSNFYVLDYLDQHLPNHFEQATQSEYKGRCLWHEERNPSLYVNVETGAFFCHACKARGNVVKLVQKVGKFDCYSDALEWLLSRYGPEREDVDDGFVLRFTERIEPGPITYADESIAQQYLTDHIPYMTDVRGIPPDILQMFDVGYCEQKNSVTIPWRDRHGRLLTVKHRAINRKAFWYEPRCLVLRHHIWGLHRCIGESVLYICEAEIDAMTLWAAGKPAVALGGSHISPFQVKQLLLAGIQAVVPVCDRDAAGEQANRQIRESVRAIGIDVYDAVWPRDDVKDCNELGVEGCRELTYELPKIFF
jgi:DNA primase